MGRRHWGGAPTAHHQRKLLRNRGARPLVCNRRHLALRSYTALEEVWEEEVEEEQKWYEQSPEPEPLSPATEKRLNDEFKRDVDECTTDSEWMSGPEGKTMSELDEKIADY